MFVLRDGLRRSLSQFRLTPNTLVTSARWSSTDSGKEASGEKSTEAGEEKKADKKPEHPNPEYQKAIQQHDEFFDEFTKSTTDLALADKQNKFLGNSNACDLLFSLLTLSPVHRHAVQIQGQKHPQSTVWRL